MGYIHGRHWSSRKQNLLVDFVGNVRFTILYIFNNVMDTFIKFSNWLSLPTEAVKESKKEDKITKIIDWNLPNLGHKLVPKF